MKLKDSFKRIHIISIIIILLSFFTISIVQAVTAEPGSDEDPVVSKSYVDAEIAKLAAKLDTLTAAAQQGGGSAGGRPESSDPNVYQVLELKAGEKLIAGASAEIIVRAGKATAIAGKNGDGLADLTSGTGLDILGNKEIPNNHLLLVSRDDGRGLKAVSDKVYLLFKGTYKISK